MIALLCPDCIPRCKIIQLFFFLNSNPEFLIAYYTLDLARR